MALSQPAPAALPTPDGVLPQASQWQLRLLGDVALSSPLGQRQRLPGRAATALLACLALAPQQALPRETVIDLLWPDADLAVGRNRLRQLLSTLKAALAAAEASSTLLLADRMTLRLRPQALRCDVTEFEVALLAGRPDEASAKYGGELMPGHFEAWIHDQRLRLAALAEPLSRPLAVGVADGPLPAGPATLGLPHYLTQLYGAAEQVAGLQADVQNHRLVTLLGPGGHGKTRLAVEVARALAGPAVAGVAAARPGEMARQAAGTSPGFDLVAFVPLVTCAGGPGATEAVLAALLLALRQAPGSGPPQQQLQRLLAGRQTLLVLDNVEQLAADIGALVADLLAGCAGLHLLVTSRRALGLDGEQQRVLPPLPLPPAQPLAGPQPPAWAQPPAYPGADPNPAVALFIDRALAVAPGFAPDAEQQAAVRALVRHLQGMPLAIELAASHVASLTPLLLLGLLQGPTGGPIDAADQPGLRLLARSGPRAAADPRHASMLAVVQWSWALLSPAARQLLPRLAVPVGSFSLAAAAALAAAPALDTALALQELAAHSMLRAEPGAGRFAMFGLIREFAAAALPPAELPLLRQRHRRWLTGWFQQLPLSTPLQQVRPEVPNLAAALAGAEADGAFDEAAALANAAQTAMSAISLPAPALAALQRCAERLTDGVQQAVTRAGLARSLLLAGQAGPAEHLAQLAIAQLPSAEACWPGDAGTPRPGLARALVLTRVAHVLWRLQRDPRAQAWLDQALRLAEQAGALALQATILTNQGALRRTADPAASIALQRQAVARWTAAQDLHGVSVGRCNLALALLARRAGAAEAVALAGQAMRDTRAQGDELQHALACNLYGEAWSRLGQWPEAAQAYRACISTAYAAAEPWPLVYGLWNLPRALAHLGQTEAAASLMGFAEQHSLGVLGPHTATDRHDLRRLRRLCGHPCGHFCGRLASAAAVQGWWQAGAALGLSQAVNRALQA